MDRDVDHHAVRQFDVFQKIQDSATKTRLHHARFRLGADHFGLGAGRFAFFRSRHGGDNALGGIQRFIRKRVGFRILLAIDVINAERFKSLRGSGITIELKIESFF